MIFLAVLVPFFVAAMFICVNGNAIWVRDYYFNAIPRSELRADLWVDGRVFRLSIFASITFLAGIVALTLRLLRPKASLILGSDGFTSFRSPKGYVAWGNVASISVKKRQGSKYLCVFLHDQALFFDENNLKNGPAMRSNTSIFGTPLAIGSIHLPAQIEEIPAKMEQLRKTCTGQ